MPKRLSGDKIRVLVQTFSQFPTIVCDAFYRQPAADPSDKRQELRAHLPSERERRWSGAEINTKVSESADALRAKYKNFDVKRFLSSVNDLSLTWVRRTTSAGNEKMVLGVSQDQSMCTILQICHLATRMDAAGALVTLRVPPSPLVFLLASDLKIHAL